MKTFVLGLDGASYHIINRMVREGKLPTFAKLIEEGDYRLLNSTTPPHTAPGWITAFTGVDPGEHGIYQFWDTQAPAYVGKFMGSDDVTRPFLWEILNEHGLRTGILNVPMTHPPSSLNGYIITWPLSNTLRYSYPPKLLHEIATVGGHYANDLSSMYDGKKEIDYIEMALDITRKRVVAIEYLCQNKTWDFMASVFTEIDRISHFYWHYMDKHSEYYQSNVESPLKNAIEAIYMETDKAVDAILNILPDETIFMILSDHGFGKGSLNFYLQSLLHRKGFLVLSDDISASRSDAFADSWYECKFQENLFYVDWGKTTAYMAAPGSFGVNINLAGRQDSGIVLPEEYELVRGKLIRLLAGVRHPESGEKLFSRVVRREDIYSGQMVDKAPDILLIPQDYSMMVHHSIQLDKEFGEPEQKGMHNNDGIFFAYKKGLSPATNTREAISLEDITPTILSCYGIPVPDYMEGCAIPIFPHAVELTHTDSACQRQKRAYGSNDAYSIDEIEDVKKKLKSLGYL